MPLNSSELAVTSSQNGQRFGQHAQFDPCLLVQREQVTDAFGRTQRHDRFGRDVA